VRNGDQFGLRCRFDSDSSLAWVYSSPSRVMFAHSDLQPPPPPPAPSDEILRVLFTEQTPSGYSVRLAHFIHHLSSTLGSMLYSVEVGDSSPSSLCLEREGYAAYGNQRVDYSSSRLRYCLKYLHPLYHYRMRAVFYHTENTRLRQRISVGNTVTRFADLDPGRFETLWVDIPPALYRGGKVELAITRVLGRRAVLADLCVYQYEDFERPLRGGGQTETVEGVAARELTWSIAPIPLSRTTLISYLLPCAVPVAIRVLDLSGRVVRTLEDSRGLALKPGRYSVNWDGGDDGRRNLASGVYFCQLEAGDIRLTAKVVLSR